MSKRLRSEKPCNIMRTMNSPVWPKRKLGWAQGGTVADEAEATVKKRVCAT